VALALLLGMCLEPSLAETAVDGLHEACVAHETPRVLKRLGIDSRVRTREEAARLVQTLCESVVRHCAAEPESASCRGSLARYGLGQPGYEPDPGRGLFDAAGNGDTAAVQRFLSEGVGPDVRNPGGWTPLMMAAAERHLETVAVLLDAKADPNLRNAFGRTALMFAARYGQLAIVERLLAAGANPNAIPTDRHGATALVAAASEGHVAVIRILLANGADASIRTCEGMTAWDMARRAGHHEAAELLKEAAFRPE